MPAKRDRMPSVRLSQAVPPFLSTLALRCHGCRHRFPIRTGASISLARLTPRSTHSSSKCLRAICPPCVSSTQISLRFARAMFLGIAARHTWAGLVEIGVRPAFALTRPPTRGVGGRGVIHLSRTIRLVFRLCGMPVPRTGLCRASVRAAGVRLSSGPAAASARTSPEPI